MSSYHDNQKDHIQTGLSSEYLPVAEISGNVVSCSNLGFLHQLKFAVGDIYRVYTLV